MKSFAHIDLGLKDRSVSKYFWNTLNIKLTVIKRDTWRGEVLWNWRVNTSRWCSITKTQLGFSMSAGCLTLILGLSKCILEVRELFMEKGEKKKCKFENLQKTNQPTSKQKSKTKNLNMWKLHRRLQQSVPIPDWQKTPFSLSPPWLTPPYLLARIEALVHEQAHWPQPCSLRARVLFLNENPAQAITNPLLTHQLIHSFPEYLFSLH